MKKILYFAAVSVMTFVSCVKNEVLPDMSDSNVIRFDTYVSSSPESKAADMTLESLKQMKGGFNVIAWHMLQGQSWDGNKPQPNTAPTFMEKTWVLNDAQTEEEPMWVYRPLRYWPSNGKITFIAWAPYTIEPNGNNTTESITLEQDKTKMLDFIWAIDKDRYKGDNKYSAQNEKWTQVVFNFEHKMSKIDFTAVTDKNYSIAGTVVTLKSIKIGGIEPSGTIDLLTGTVTAVDGTDVEYTWTADESELASPSTLAVKTKDVPLESILASGTQLIVCPQSARTLPITVVYTTKTGDDEEVEHTVNTSIPSIALEANTVYTFNLKVGLSQIDINADISSWEGAKNL